MMNTTVMIRYVCTNDIVFIYNKNNNYNTANNNSYYHKVES